MRLEQQASEELVNQANRRGNAIKRGAEIALSVGSFAIPGSTAMKGLQKILPFLNESLPVELAVKGLSKINPRIKEFISKASIGGYTAKDAIDFMREKSQETLAHSAEMQKKLEAEKKFKEHRKKTSMLEEEAKRFHMHYSPEKRRQNEEVKLKEENTLQQLQHLREERERQKIQGTKQKQQQGVGNTELMQVLQQINQRLG